MNIPDSARDPRFSDMLAGSHVSIVGERLVPTGLRGAEAAAWLYDAPTPLLAHDTSSDPLFVYANRKAQEVFGYSGDEFVGLPSRLTAGEQDRACRGECCSRPRSPGPGGSGQGCRVRLRPAGVPR
jgi:PAS domain-containing protein